MAGLRFTELQSRPMAFLDFTSLTLDGELGAIFKRWYPDMDLEVERISVAA